MPRQKMIKSKIRSLKPSTNYANNASNSVLINLINIYKRDSKLFKGSINNSNFDKYIYLDIANQHINVMPFLASSLSGFESSDHMVVRSLFKLVNNYEYEKYITEPFEEEFLNSYYKDLLQCILTERSEISLNYFVLYSYFKNPANTIRVIYDIISEALVSTSVSTELYDKMFNYLESGRYKVNICDTRRFCICLAFYWVMTSTPSICKLISKDITSEYIYDLMINYLPEKSIHYKYICNEISAKELKDLYLKEDKNDVSIMMKEYYRTENDKRLSELKNPARALDNIKLTDLDKYLINELYRETNLPIEYSVCMNMFRAFLHDNKFESYVKEHRKLIDKHNEFLKARSDTSNNLVLEKEKTKKLEKELKNVSRELETIKFESNSKRELKKQINDLKVENNKKDVEIKNLNSDISTFVNNELEIRQENSSLKKEIKKLRALLEANPNIEEDIDELINKESEVTTEDAADFVKSKRFYIIGGSPDSHIEDGLKKYDITNFGRTTFGERLKGTTGVYDFVVVFTGQVKHQLLFSANKRFKDVPMIYCNTTSVENMLLQIYNYMN